MYGTICNLKVDKSLPVLIAGDPERNSKKCVAEQ